MGDRPRPAGRGGGRPRDGRGHDPKPLGDLMRRLVAGRGWGERMALGRLREAWPDVVGANVAGRSAPVALVRGALTVRADGGAWATELTLMAPALAARAGVFLGDPAAVREVRVVAGPGSPASGASGSTQTG